MQRLYLRSDTDVLLPIALAAVQAILIGGILWQVSRIPDRGWESRSAGSEVPVLITRPEADAVATAHTPGRVLDTDLIRDNGVVSYLVTVDPDNDDGDAAARRVLFVDPATKSVWRDERWNTKAERAVHIARQQAETAALKLAGTASGVRAADLLRYEQWDVWLVKVARNNAPPQLVTLDAGSGEVLRTFELVRDY